MENLTSRSNILLAILTDRRASCSIPDIKTAYTPGSWFRGKRLQVIQSEADSWVKSEACALKGTGNRKGKEVEERIEG